MGTDDILEYYDEYDEWSRLDTPRGQVELRRSLRVIDAYLPEAARVLDLGGGPGRYTIELARRGHSVTLVDLTPKHVERARREVDERDLGEHVDAIVQGDARDLDQIDADSFDAVVAFGPFYHLVDPDALDEAAEEVARVLRPDGLVFAQYLPPLSGYVRLLDRAADAPDRVDLDTVDRAFAEGVYRNPADHGYQEAWYAQTHQIAALFAERGFEQLDALSVRGLAAYHEQKLVDLREQDPEMYEKFSTLLDRTARRPEVLELGQIAIWVGRLSGG